MASKAQIEAVEVYTTTEPCMSKSLQYKGLVLASKVKSRNMFSDIGSGFKSLVFFWRMETNSVFEGVLDMVVVGTAVSFTR